MSKKNFLHVTAKQEGIGGSYRLASLDRLANRQRVLEQNNGLGQADMMKNGNGTSATESSVNGNGGGFTVGVRKLSKNLVSWLVLFVVECCVTFVTDNLLTKKKAIHEEEITARKFTKRDQQTVFLLFVLHDFLFNEKKTEIFQNLLKIFSIFGKIPGTLYSISIELERFSKFFNIHSGNSKNSVK